MYESELANCVNLSTEFKHTTLHRAALQVWESHRPLLVWGCRQSHAEDQDVQIKWRGAIGDRVLFYFFFFWQEGVLSASLLGGINPLSLHVVAEFIRCFLWHKLRRKEKNPYNEPQKTTLRDDSPTQEAEGTAVQ